VSEPGVRECASRATVCASEITKLYPRFLRRRDRAVALLTGRSSSGTLVAVDRVSFEVNAGEALGIIGENGSGKSSLLRLVAGITRPDRGRLSVNGRVAAILELGVGFHPDFSGRENAVFYGALVGVPDEVMREKLDEILAFAEIGEFVDQPVRTYSTGMAARLAFAVATHVDPKILVVDEALAVGDGAFQKKCVDRMVRIKNEGRAVLFCSHAMHLVSGFCERALWLRKGKVEACGATREVVQAYDEYLRHQGQREIGEGLPVTSRAGASVAKLEIEPAGRQITPGEAVTICTTVVRLRPGMPLHLAFVLEDQSGQCLACFATLWDGRPPLDGGTEQHVTLRIPSIPLARGQVDVTAVLADETGLQIIDQVVFRRAISVNPGRWEPGLFTTEHDWEVS